MKQKIGLAFVIISFLCLSAQAKIPSKTPTEQECIQRLYQALQECVDYKNHKSNKSENCIVNRIMGLENRCCKESEDLCDLHEKVGNHALHYGNDEVAAIAYKLALMHCKKKLRTKQG